MTRLAIRASRVDQSVCPWRTQSQMSRGYNPCGHFGTKLNMHPAAEAHLA